METSNFHQNINYDFLSADDIAQIEKNTDVILREIGNEIEDDIESLNALQALGGTIEHYQNLVALAHSSAALQTTGYLLCTVHNLPQQTCHIDMALSHLTLSDKPFMGPVASPQAIHDVAELLGIERFVPG